MKAQNCPRCHMIPIVDKISESAICRNLTCFLGRSSIDLDLWNRIRLAPDDQPIKMTEHCLAPWQVYFTTRPKDWMNPNFEWIESIDEKGNLKDYSRKNL